jgi:ubiquinone/menaquinone biosynthesis C-methylase UbiE
MRARTALILVGVATGAGAWWARTHPSACPYAQRWLLGRRPLITRERLLEVLAPAPGERILELGPGTGFYSFPVAEQLAGGTLAVFDLQQEMLDHLMRDAGRRGLTNLEPTQGDAAALPYPEAGFDAAFLVTVLGEIPDPDSALRELRRVLKPGGRLVVGELVLGDPHFVTPRTLRERAKAAGFEFERQVGPWAGYYARFTRA